MFVYAKTEVATRISEEVRVHSPGFLSWRNVYLTPAFCPSDYFIFGLLIFKIVFLCGQLFQLEHKILILADSRS